MNSLHQGYYFHLWGDHVFSSTQFGCKKLPAKGQKIAPRIWSESGSQMFYVEVDAKGKAILYSDTNVEIAESENPRLRKLPGQPERVLQTNHVRLTLSIPDMKLTLTQAP